MPDIPERAAFECIVNGLIHRDYLELGSEVHIDIFDDRMEIYSPGGMFDGSFVQDLDTDHVPSRRRNPVIADIFSRMNYMERRGSGFKKIKDDYHRAVNYCPELEPQFYSNTTSFWVTLYNLNYQVPIDEKRGIIKKQVLENEKINGFNQKPLFANQKTVVSNQKPLFEERLNALQMSMPTRNKIVHLYEEFGDDAIFSRTDVMRLTGITSSPAGDLIHKLKEMHFIEPVKGFGKGKYRFKR